MENRQEGDGSFGGGSHFRRQRGGGFGGRRGGGDRQHYKHSQGDSDSDSGCGGDNRNLSKTHPRSLYKTFADVDIRKLISKYRELEPYVVKGDDGATKINFRDCESLCALTQVIVKRDFRLDLELPSSKVLPYLQLWYNYLLWVEDLLEKWPSKTGGEVVNGIDIGSNASVLYALIAAKKNNWKMLTSEYDDTIFGASERNIRLNCLQNLVTVKKVNDRTFLEGILDPNIPCYDFCMFSPPVLNNKQAKMIMGNMDDKFNPSRALTGRSAEVVAAGGEKMLMMNIIRESVKLKNQIKLFTIMVARKASVDSLGPELLKLVGDDFVGTFAFSYGPQPAFVLAWTFDQTVQLKNEDRLMFRTKSRKQPLQHTINNRNLTAVFSRVIEVLEKVMVNYKVLEKTDEKYTLEISSYYVFWSKKGNANAGHFIRKLYKNDSDGPEAKRMKLDDHEANIGLMSKIFQEGNTLAILATMDIVQQKNKLNSVMIEIEVIGGTASATGGDQIMNYFKSQPF